MMNIELEAATPRPAHSLDHERAVARALLSLVEYTLEGSEFIEAADVAEQLALHLRRLGERKQ